MVYTLFIISGNENSVKCIYSISYYFFSVIESLKQVFCRRNYRSVSFVSVNNHVTFLPCGLAKDELLLIRVIVLIEQIADKCLITIKST